MPPRRRLRESEVDIPPAITLAAVAGFVVVTITAGVSLAQYSAAGLGELLWLMGAIFLALCAMGLAAITLLTFIRDMGWRLGAVHKTLIALGVIVALTCVMVTAVWTRNAAMRELQEKLQQR